jgi:glycosyltransferase involved in cell wall biosynthesis
MQKAPVTVIIPTFNCAGFLAQAVDSVLAQTVVPSQIIVVDDGSSDATEVLLAPYRNRIQYIFQPNLGVSTARNRGLAEAGHDLIAFLDADDVWHSRKIEAQLEAFSQQPELGLLGTKGFELPVDIFPEIPMRERWVLRPATMRQLVVRSYFVTSTVMIRREVLRRVGAFDPQLRRAEDRDLYIRVARHYPVANLDLPLTGFRTRGDSLSRQVVTMRQDGEKLIHKLGTDRQDGIDRLLLRQASSYLDYNCANTCEAAGLRFQAIRYLLRSMVRYPMPFQREATRIWFERPKRLLVLLWRMITHRSPEAEAVVVHDDTVSSEHI